MTHVWQARLLKMMTDPAWIVTLAGMVADKASQQLGVLLQRYRIGPALSPGCVDVEPVWKCQRPALFGATRQAAASQP